MTDDDSLVDAAVRGTLDAEHRAIDDLSPAQPTGPGRIDDDDRTRQPPVEEPLPHLKEDHGHRMTH